MINSFTCSRNKSNYSDTPYCSKKGSRLSVAAFLLLFTAFLSSACESPGPVGGDIISDREPVESQTVYIENYSVLEESSFSGRLANTAIGYFEDPLYGTMKSVALLKPSISTADVDTIRQNDTISLRLIFSSTVYGDSLATSSFEIYEAGEIWRGAELRYNRDNPIDIDMSGKVADFQVSANTDTVIVDLNETWTDKFAQYFNSDTTLTSAQRDSVYINNFRGLAIVPSESNQNIRFLKTRATDDDEDDEELITSFLFESLVQDEDDEDEGPEIISVRDWGVDFTREMVPDATDGFILHNTDRVLKIEPNLPVEELSSKNIVNAQLIFSKDDRPLQNASTVNRPGTNLIRAHVFNEEPNDVMAEIFTREAAFATSLDDTSNAFLMDVTPFVVNGVYGDVNDRIIYVTMESVNGLFYSSHFFGPSSDTIRKPRIVITYVEE